MNLFFILFLIVLIIAGYYVYQRLLKIEREIRSDQQPLAEAEESPAKKADSASFAPEGAGVASASGASGISEKILIAVEDSPGLSQTEIYAKFPDEDRRELQRLLRELDQTGSVRREKKGSSYRLYPL